LVNGTLVLQDRETDSYWPIMQGRSFHGALEGTRMQELTVSDKVTWRDWRARHPDTLVLSVNGKQDKEQHYEKYFASADGFRGLSAKDSRLQTKQPIYAFRIEGNAYAIRYEDAIGGGIFKVPNGEIFAYRPTNADLMQSTSVYADAEFTSVDGVWGNAARSCRFDSNRQSYEGINCPARVPGFDTFWYSWSLNNPDTKLLEAAE
jgi:hypothetical protein